MKTIFLEEIRSFETVELYITESVEELTNEIYENMISLGLPEGVANEIEAEDILVFLARLKANRKEQLLKGKIKIDLIYYIWYDSGAGQLCLNIINANHLKLPFGAKLNLEVTEREIVEAFIEGGKAMYTYEEKDDFDEPSETNDWEKLENERVANYVLPVYSEIIKHKD
jgi:hypothetical protein